MKPHRSFGPLAFAALLALLVVPSRAVASPPMLPLDIGNRWEYQGTGGLQQVETITGTRTVLGRTVFAKSYTVGPDAGLENWWLLDVSGGVLLAGFDNPSFGPALAYDPPIPVIGGAPMLGDSWPTHVIAYQLPGMAVYAEFDITFSVLEVGDIIVPAGTFPSFGVGQVVAPALSAFAAAPGFRLDGRRVPAGLKAATSNATDWFSPGVGLVQYRASDFFQLTGFGNPTPVRATSWGMLKQLYR